MREGATNISRNDRYVQPDLLTLPDSRSNGAQFNGKSVFSDPAFAQNKTLPLHRWVPWIAGFSQDFVQDALNRHLKKRGTVLDPFSGVGTTLVESMLAGHGAIGFEINPYAALACQVKLSSFNLKREKVLKYVEQYKNFLQIIETDSEPVSQIPEAFTTRGEFYSPKVLKKVLFLQDFIKTIDDKCVKDLFRIAFASTMVSYSNYSYEPSLGQRKSAGKENIEDAPVEQIIEAKLSNMVQDISWVQSKVSGLTLKSKIINESFFSCRKHLKSKSVDLLITSPPYLNNYHYNRNTRPHLYWLDFVRKPKDLSQLERDNFGKYWQTVREEQCIELDERITDPEIKEAIHELRQKNPSKGIYGGNGWANYAASYFNDCYRFSECTKYVLKRGGTALVVIGNSILQGVNMPTDKFLVKIAGTVGLEPVEIHIPRATRVGNSIIKSGVRVEKAHHSHTLYEAVVELRNR